MSIKNKYKKAIKLINENNPEGLTLLLEIYPYLKDYKIKNQIAFILINKLGPAKFNEKLIYIIEDIIKMSIAQNNYVNAISYMTKKISFLLYRISMLISKKENIILASRRIGDIINFSLERDKNEYEYCDTNIKQSQQEIDNLAKNVDQMLKNCPQAFQNKLKAQILAHRGESYFSDLTNITLQYKGNRIPTKIQYHIITKKPFYSHSLLPFIYNKKTYKRLHKLEQLGENNFLQSYNILKEEGDQIPEAINILILLAGQLSLTTLNFRKAKKYLRQANNLAIKTNHKELLPQIESFYKNIKFKK